MLLFAGFWFPGRLLAAPNLQEDLSQAVDLYRTQDFTGGLTAALRLSDDNGLAAADRELSQAARMLACLCRYQLGELENAATSCAELMQEQANPFAAKAGILLGAQHLACGDTEAAETTFKFVIETYTPGADAGVAHDWLICSVAVQEGARRDAQPVSSPKLGDRAKEEVLRVFGAASVNNEQTLGDAEARFRQLLDKAHESDEAYPWPKQRLCRPRVAADFYLRALAENPRAVGAPEASLRLAELCLDGDTGFGLEDAAAILRHLVATSPDNTYLGMRARLMLCDILYRSRRDLECCEFIETAASLLAREHLTKCDLDQTQYEQLRSQQLQLLSCVGAAFLSVGPEAYPRPQRIAARIAKAHSGTSVGREAVVWLEAMSLRALDMNSWTRLSLPQMRKGIMEQIQRLETTAAAASTEEGVRVLASNKSG